jgi:hypothetical protein
VKSVKTFGALGFGSINPELTSIGVIAGLVAFSVANFIGVFFGGVQIMTVGPYSMSCDPLAILRGVRKVFG